MHPGHVVAPAVDADAGLLQALDASRDVLALEAHEVDAFAVLGEEAADRFVRIGRLQELDVADTRRQDRVLESELLGVRSVMYFQTEEPGEALDRGVEIAHHDRQLDDVAQHDDSPPSDGRADHTVESAGSHARLPRKNPVLRLGGHRRGIRDDGHRRQRAHGVLAALSADPRRVRLAARAHGRRVLVRVPGLGDPRSPAGPADGPARSALGHAARRRDGRRGPRSGPARDGALASHLTLGVLVAGGTVCLGYTGHALFLANWFVRRRGLAIGIAFSGVGVGSIVILPWLQRLIAGAGWRTACLAMAALVVVALAPLNLLTRRRPEDMGLLPDGDRAPEAAARGG